MKSTSAIGLDNIKSQQLADKLNDRLANFSAYMTVSKIHEGKQVTEGIRVVTNLRLF